MQKGDVCSNNSEGQQVTVWLLGCKFYFELKMLQSIPLSNHIAYNQ